MIRRRTRTPKQRALLAYKQAAPIGIGETCEDQEVREHVETAAIIQSVHDYIWMTRLACQLCGGARRAECMGLNDQMHEDPPRSATRGLPPASRFNLIVCGRLCAACHRDVTENRLRVIFHKPALGFLGPVSAEAI